MMTMAPLDSDAVPQQHQTVAMDDPLYPLSPTSHDRFSTHSSALDSIPTTPLPHRPRTFTKQKQQRKRVQFSNKRDVFPIISLDDYTDQEVDGCWVTREEKQKFVKSIERAVRRMASGLDPKPNSTYRGLESFAESNHSDQTILDCIDAVMDEQGRQWEVYLDEWKYDFDRFRELSLEVSHKSAEIAAKRARCDASQAHKAYIAMSQAEGEDEDGSSVESQESNENQSVFEVPQSLKVFAGCPHGCHPSKRGDLSHRYERQVRRRNAGSQC